MNTEVTRSEHGHRGILSGEKARSEHRLGATRALESRAPSIDITRATSFDDALN
jgi:hypothetical protein